MGNRNIIINSWAHYKCIVNKFIDLYVYSINTINEILVFIMLNN